MRIALAIAVGACLLVTFVSLPNVALALTEPILDIAQRQRTPHVHHHNQADDLR